MMIVSAEILLEETVASSSSPVLGFCFAKGFVVVVLLLTGVADVDDDDSQCCKTT
jgi:hypothetical protein